MEPPDRSRNSPLEERTQEPNLLPLLLTKLHRPRVGLDLEQRRRLLQSLDLNADRSLTLISAPAGYGKTTLASTWVQASDRVSAWVSLDERDDDLVIFTAYLLAAMRGAFPTTDFRTQALLRSPQVPAASTLARYLINDLEQITAPFVLVLDDIHLVKQQAIFDLLGEMLRHPLPTMHLVLSGRRDPPLPVALLRAHGQVTEIRVRDLALTASETARLLGHLLDRDIPEDIAAEWTLRTEGWVTGLRLAALSLLQGGQTDNLKVSLPGSPQYLQDYFLADVLGHLPPDKRDWLLRVSLLDRFCASLCEAVCRPDGDADGTGLTGTAFVRWLCDDNLFLVTLDDQGEWYRLHHLFRGLLKNLLQEQLGLDQITRVRLRASAWCAENGLQGEAIEYALASGHASTAMQVLIQYRYDLINAGQWLYLEHWLKRLPDGVVTQSPLLLSTEAFLALHHNDPQSALALCQQAAQLLAALPPDSEEHRAAKAELAVLEPLPLFLQGQFAAAIASTRASLASLPPQALYMRALAISHIAFGLLASGNGQECMQTCSEALTEPDWPVSARALLLRTFCGFQFMLGDLIGVLETATECLRFAGKFQLADLANLARYYLGAAHYLRDEWRLAEPHLLALLDDALLLDPSFLAFGAFALALIHQGEGREAEAEKVIATASTHLQEIEHPGAYTLIPVFMSELGLRRGDTRRARQLPMHARPGGYLDIYWYSIDLTGPKLLLADRTPESLAEARRRLDALSAGDRASLTASQRIDALALLALVHDALGEETAALDSLQQALNLARSGGSIRNFVDLGPPMADLLARLRRRERVAHSAYLPYLNKVLAAFPPQAQAGDRPNASSAAAGASSRPPSLAEPLTEQELKILALLATDFSPEEMAAQLFVSVATVRTHIRNIYGKLGVHSRFQAVQVAEKLGLR